MLVISDCRFLKAKWRRPPLGRKTNYLHSTRSRVYVTVGHLSVYQSVSHIIRPLHAVAAGVLPGECLQACSMCTVQQVPALSSSGAAARRSTPRATMTADATS